MNTNNNSGGDAMSQWITDRLPTKNDAPNGYVWTTIINDRTGFSRWDAVKDGVPWMPMLRPDPYVKPKRYVVCNSITGLSVFDNVAKVFVGSNIPTREAADRIAAIYEEVTP